MNGKGDTYRPTDKERFDRNYERVFGINLNNSSTYSGELNKETLFKAVDKVKKNALTRQSDSENTK